LYITVYNYSAVVGIYTMTCLSAWNMDNFKFAKAQQAKIVYNYKYTTEKLYEQLLYFLCQVPSSKWLKKAKTCRRTTTHLYIIIPNYCAVGRIYSVTCLTVWNMDDFELSSI
jgi:hypothetical protein